MIDNKIIDEILTLLNTQDNVPIHGFLSEKGINDDRVWWRYIDHLKKMGIADHFGEDNPFMFITPHGQEICKLGGWIKYIENNKYEKKNNHNSVFIIGDKNNINQGFSSNNDINLIKASSKTNKETNSKLPHKTWLLIKEFILPIIISLISAYFIYRLGFN